MDINLLESFERTVRAQPQKTAISYGDESVSFEHLKKRAFGLAEILLENYDVPFGKPVAVFLPKGIDVAVADIACMYDACIFMNLDIKTPLERIGNILSLIEPQIILTDTAHSESIASVCWRYSRH